MLISTYTTNRLLSLNRFNFDEVYPFLLPRAVTYSAGLINHFFRGRLSVEKVRWMLTTHFIISVTNNSYEGNSLQSGNFELYYESVEGIRKPVQVNMVISNNFSFMGGDIVENNNLPLQVGNSVDLISEYPADLNTNLDTPFILVFNGLDGGIGNEPGIATTRFQKLPQGKVESIDELGTECPGELFSIRIFFEQQPVDNGRVFLMGRESRTQFDFTLVNAGASTVISRKTYFHGIDPSTGLYLYTVNNNVPEEGFEPCIVPSIGPWIEGEKVIAMGLNGLI